MTNREIWQGTLVAIHPWMWRGTGSPHGTTQRSSPPRLYWQPSRLAVLPPSLPLLLLPPPPPPQRRARVWSPRRGQGSFLSGTVFLPAAHHDRLGGFPVGSVQSEHGALCWWREGGLGWHGRCGRAGGLCRWAASSEEPGSACAVDVGWCLTGEPDTLSLPTLLPRTFHLHFLFVCPSLPSRPGSVVLGGPSWT